MSTSSLPVVERLLFLLMLSLARVMASRSPRLHSIGSSRMAAEGKRGGEERDGVVKKKKKGYEIIIPTCKCCSLKTNENCSKMKFGQRPFNLRACEDRICIWSLFFLFSFFSLNNKSPIPWKPLPSCTDLLAPILRWHFVHTALH